MTRPNRPLALVVVASALWASLAAAQSQPKWPSQRAPRPLAARDVQFPPYEIRTLPNGLQVVVVVHGEQPAVSLRMIVRAGGAQDPAGKPGVAAMVASLLDQGTATLSARQVAETIDSAGGELEVGVGRDLTHARVLVMKDALALGMRLLADVLRNPAFADEELTRQRQQTLSALQVSYQDPEYVADVVFDRLVYGLNPYGAPGDGTTDSVTQISRDDLVAFHRAHFAPNNCLLAVVGDIGVEEAIGAAARAFGEWEARPVPPFDPPEPPSPARRVLVVDKPGAVQTEIRVGHLGIARKSPDFTALDLAIRVLGGEGANRLHRVLRIERGLTYGASADTETLRRSGEVVAETSTRSDATGEALRVMVDEFWRLRRERVDVEELSEAKAYLTGRFPLTIETPDDIATQVLTALFYELPLDELRTYRQRINRVDVDDLEQVAIRYLRPDRLSVVLVGNASAFVDQLKGAGFGKYDVIDLADLDLSVPALKKVTPGAVLPGPRTSYRRPGFVVEPLVTRLDARTRAGERAGSARQAPETAASLLKQAIDAMGGLDKLESVKTVRAVAVTTMMLPQGAVRAGTTTYIEYPDRFRVEASLPTGSVIQVYAGEENVWVKDPARGVIEVPPAARRDFRASVARDILSLLVRAARGEAKTRLIEAEGGAPGAGEVGVLELTAPGFDPVWLHVERATGLVLRQSYRLPGGSGQADELYSDYRDVDGLKVAFRASVRRNNLAILERVVTEFEVNPPLKQGLFDRSRDPGQGPAGLPGPASPGPASPAGAAVRPPAARPGAPAPPDRASAPAVVRDAAARELIDRAIAANGGAERLKAVRTLRTKAVNSSPTDQGTVKADTTTYVQYPDRYRVENRQGGALTVALLVGDDLTLLAPGEGGRFAPEPKSEVSRGFKASVQRDIIPLLLRAASGEVTLRLVAEDPAAQAGSGLAFIEVSGRDLEPVVLGIDRESARVTRLSYALPPASKDPWVDETFDDFRDVGGVKMPFKSAIHRGTTLIRERTVTEYAVNPPLDPALFDKSRLK